MNLRKVIACVAVAAVATSALAVTASAKWIPGDVDTSYIDKTGNGNFGIFPYSTGEADCPKSTLAEDYGFELDEIGGVTVTITVPETGTLGNADNREVWADPDWGAISGGIVTSLHSDTDKSTYNWPSQGEYWGVLDEDLGLETLDPEKAYQWEKVGDYTYKLTAMFNFDEALSSIEGDHIVQYRIFVCAWDDASYAEYEVTECGLLNDAGEALVTMDGRGNVTASKYGFQSGSDNGDAEGGDTGAGDVDGETDGGKDSPDTGIEEVAVVAGLAIVAAGAIAISRKRK